MKGNVSFVGKSVLYFLMFMIVLNFLMDVVQKSLTPPPPPPQQCESNGILHSIGLQKKDPSSRYKYWAVDKSKPKLPDYKRYVVYNQNNGFNNQLIELQHSIYLALLLNRTLILPDKLGQKVHLAKRRNWGEYFDLDDLGRGVSFVLQKDMPDAIMKSMGEAIVDIMWSREPNSTVYTDTIDNLRIELANGHDLYPILDNLKRNPNQLFRFPHLWGTRNFFTLPDYVEEKLLHITNNYLHFKDELFIKALRIVDLLGEDFAAAHIRTTDMRVNFYYRHVWYMPDMVSRKTKIYIATDAQYIGKGKNGTADDLLAVFGTNIYSWSNFSHLFNDTTPDQAEDNDYVGTIEQCVCVMAKQFFGTKGSTFSSKIVKMRALYRQSYMQKHFDTFP